MDMNYGGGGMWEGGGGQDGWSGIGGGEWDNCNSIINKYIKNKVKFQSFKKKQKRLFISCLNFSFSSSDSS